MSEKAITPKSLHGTGKEYWRRLGADLLRDRWLYLLLLPGLIGYWGVFWAEVLAWVGADLILVPAYWAGFAKVRKMYGEEN